MNRIIVCEEGEHADLGASSADRWMACAGSIVLSKGVERTSSVYADEGTAAHKLLQLVLTENQPASYWRGDTFVVGQREFEATEEMVDNIQLVVDNVRRMAAGNLVIPESRVNYNQYLQQAKLTAFGTADVTVIVGDEIQVHDLKYGRGVKVSADDNPQLKFYGLGVLAAHSDTLGPFEKVRLVIHQPRISPEPSEHVISVSDLTAWGFGPARRAANMVVGAIVSKPTVSPEVWESAYLKEGEAQCRWCPAATCPKRASAVLDLANGREGTVASIDEFDALPSNLGVHVAPATDEWLGAALSKCDLLEGFIAALRAEGEKRLLAGAQVPG